MEDLEGEQEVAKTEIKFGIDLKQAEKKYNLDWWNKQVLFFEDNKMRKQNFQNIFSENIYKDDLPVICYSLTKHAYELNKNLNNPELFFYNIFINPDIEGEKPKKGDIEKFIETHHFKHQLGYFVSHIINN